MTARLRGWLRRVLRLRLFTKILVANGVLLSLAAAGILASAWIGPARGNDPVLRLAVGLVAATVVLGVTLNAAILRLALEPIEGLTRAATAVRAGDLTARAPSSPFADPDVERLVRAFNEALDAVAGYRARLRRWSARARRAEEAERERIARELHEEVAQDFAALLVRLRTNGTALDPGALDRVLEESRDRIVNAIDRLRSLSREDPAAALPHVGLARVVEGWMRSRVLPGGPEVGVAERGEAAIDPEQERALFRVVQEAADNAFRHGAARRIAVAIERRPDGSRVSVEDDGRGFDPACVGEDALGLFAMRERMESVGGDLEVRSRPGDGTRVVATVPAAPAAPGG